MKISWQENLPLLTLRTYPRGRGRHLRTGSGYTPNEIVFGTHTHTRTKGPSLAEPKAVAQDAAHYFQKREELHALARRAMVHVQGVMKQKHDKGTDLSKVRTYV